MPTSEQEARLNELYSKLAILAASGNNEEFDKTKLELDQLEESLWPEIEAAFEASLPPKPANWEENVRRAEELLVRQENNE